MCLRRKSGKSRPQHGGVSVDEDDDDDDDGDERGQSSHHGDGCYGDNSGSCCPLVLS